MNEVAVPTCSTAPAVTPGPTPSPEIETSPVSQNGSTSQPSRIRRSPKRQEQPSPKGEITQTGADLLTVALLAIECLEDRFRAAGLENHVVLAADATAAIERLADGARDSLTSPAIASVHHIQVQAGGRRRVVRELSHLPSRGGRRNLMALPGRAGAAAATEPDGTGNDS